mmetsp:Transcript_14667/g.20937  ORF Transcript_14667/g.20937 Transcript_14667/m.20937 type:complete len:441 (+) Transcript_14667:153-1475(+)|eukprot:CAMPEP_0184864200 /NCGR_PEP_ID=MMETSP0580-20130426/14086_1 /TAXON_ID=1118495 /ORGANISM="Dactyliosolen fragilissimus" /LENGTH=440 /DNA_ID=CAMNT_0027362887 /DNA_START=126 /DNA_END=1448 /DNA_ORIENTATION=+
MDKHEILNLFEDYGGIINKTEGDKRTRITKSPHQTASTKAKLCVGIIIGLAFFTFKYNRALASNFAWPRLGNALQKAASNNDKDEDSFEIERTLSIDLGNGNCEWTPSVDADQEKPLFTTLVAAYPGSGKRTAFMQFEGLTGLKTGDDHNLNAAELSKKYAFMKTSYPQHEGIWSWGGKMNQVVFLIRNPRWAIPSYYHLLNEINFAKEWEEAYENMSRTYSHRSVLQKWYDWKAIRFQAEIHWWSWFVDYWMEGGLMRDIFTHELTTPEHWSKLVLGPTVYPEPQLRASQAALPRDLPFTYDPHCIADLPGCQTMAIASLEKIMDPVTGPDEVAKFSSVLENKIGVEVISPEARPCVWRELITNRKGVRNMWDRDGHGPPQEAFGFTADQMGLIIQELRRIKDKYSSPEWAANHIATELVSYVTAYIVENETELASLHY